MPETTERLAALETLVRSMADVQKQESEERRKRTHTLANQLMSTDRTLNEIKIALVPLAALPARVAALESTAVLKDDLKKDLKAFGLDTGEPTEGANAITFAKEARANSLAVKKHGIFVLITIVAGAALTGGWQAFKSAVVHP